MQAQSARLMLEWIVRWVESILDESGAVNLEGADSMLLFAADLLTEFGVIQKENYYKYASVSSIIHLPISYDFQKILYAFYHLGGFYGYNVRFLEEGFKVTDHLKPLFENLVQLGYCSTCERFYFWTEKTSDLSNDGYGIWLHPKESVYNRHLECLRKPHMLEGRSTERDMAIIKALHLRNKIGITDENSAIETEQALTAWLNNWQKNPIIWPDTIRT